MPLNLASPGILVREVDLTIGRVDTTTDKIGGIVGSFEKGPIGEPVQITSENELLNTFGRPHDVDKQYEDWLVASSYLAYGGQLSVIRADDTHTYNGAVGTASSVKIRSQEHYEALGYDKNVITGKTVVAKNPGTWSNDIRVAIIDGAADQTISVASTANVTVGMGVTQSFSKVISGAGGTSVSTGVLKGIVTKLHAGKNIVDVKVVGLGATAKDYNNTYKFAGTGAITFSADGSTLYPTTASQEVDWWDQQELTVATGTTISWNTIADRPGTSSFAAARGSRNDEVHVVVIDAKGSITGNAGTILEKNLFLSKAKDAEFSVGSPSYWRSYLASGSDYIYGGGGNDIDTIKGGFTSVDGWTNTDQEWDQDADGIIFNFSGPQDKVISGGKNYGGKTDLTTTGALDAGLDDLISGYGKFENDTTVDVDFLLMGTGKYGEDESRALAEKLIAVAEARKDAVAFISPYRASQITDTSTDTDATLYSDAEITTKVTDYYSTITSSSYAVFDSGYKYIYDRFNNTFRWIPVNGDIAGCCARTDINDFPWFSPAGTDRGTILNAVKLAYNPTKLQRDALYSNRVNPVIHSPGSGIILFGDKTGFAKASAFDRINVRRLFIYLEDAISAAAKDQLFEFNDEITRSNFVNIVEPFLRDVQAKRGIQDFVVICDETNNTAAVIDSNEFIADIYIKPARSINFIGLTFIATRTGVSFEEVIGNV